MSLLDLMFPNQWVHYYSRLEEIFMTRKNDRLLRTKNLIWTLDSALRRAHCLNIPSPFKLHDLKVDTNCEFNLLNSQTELHFTFSSKYLSMESERFKKSYDIQFKKSYDILKYGNIPIFKLTDFTFNYVNLTVLTIGIDDTLTVKLDDHTEHPVNLIINDPNNELLDFQKVIDKADVILSEFLDVENVTCEQIVNALIQALPLVVADNKETSSVATELKVTEG